MPRKVLRADLSGILGVVENRIPEPGVPVGLDVGAKFLGDIAGTPHRLDIANAAGARGPAAENQRIVVFSSQREGGKGSRQRMGDEVVVRPVQPLPEVMAGLTDRLRNGANGGAQTGLRAEQLGRGLAESIHRAGGGRVAYRMPNAILLGVIGHRPGPEIPPPAGPRARAMVDAGPD